MCDLILARALRLALLTDLRRATAAHRPTRRLRARLALATAHVAALEARA